MVAPHIAIDAVLPPLNDVLRMFGLVLSPKSFDGIQRTLLDWLEDIEMQIDQIGQESGLMIVSVGEADH